MLKVTKSWPEKIQGKDACGKIGDIIKGTRTAQLFKLTELSNSGG